MIAPTHLVPLDDSGPKVRLLYCSVCQTIEELPPFEGRPENDVLLEISVEKHQSNGVPHTGHLFNIGLKLWGSPRVRQEIIKQIKGGSGGLSEFDPTYYDTKSTFGEDALTCYAGHLRPKGACPDWRSDKKRLVPQTRAERRELGMPSLKEVGGPKVYLCDFCPAKAFYMTKSNEQKGLYK